MKYIYCTIKESAVVEFDKKLNKLIQEGWEMEGNAYGVGIKHCQLMSKYVKT